jgi:hypothetical protein
MENELRQVLGGRSVDLRTQMDLSRHFREDVVRNAQVIYVEPRCRSPAAHAGGRHVRIEHGRRTQPVGLGEGCDGLKHGAGVVVEQHHRPVAVISPVKGPGRPIDECIALAKAHGSGAKLDEEYAADLEEIIASREPLDTSVWDCSST